MREAINSNNPPYEEASAVAQRGTLTVTRQNLRMRGRAADKMSTGVEEVKQTGQRLLRLKQYAECICMLHLLGFVQTTPQVAIHHSSVHNAVRPFTK